MGERLALFVTHLVHENKQSSTVKSYMSAIKAVLSNNGCTDINEDEFLIGSLTRACRLKNDRVIHRLPIQKGMLAI